MGDNTGIEWTNIPGTKRGATWNPVVGCSIHSPGCTNCYAMIAADRLSRMGTKTPPAIGTGLASKYSGLTEMSKVGPVWNGVVRIDESSLDQPTRWRTSRGIFVNSMSDLFHEALSWEDIGRVYAQMSSNPQHVFIVCTKRADRMRQWLAGFARDPSTGFLTHNGRTPFAYGGDGIMCAREWPLPNVWHLISAEDQPRLEERLPDLIASPSIVRGISFEPLIGDVDLLAAFAKQGVLPVDIPSLLHWAIPGGESGPGARGCYASWIDKLINDCTIVRVPVFLKQLGRQFVDDMGLGIKIKHRKGADPEEWPDAWRFHRDFPSAAFDRFEMRSGGGGGGKTHAA